MHTRRRDPRSFFSDCGTGGASALGRYQCRCDCFTLLYLEAYEAETLIAEMEQRIPNQHDGPMLEALKQLKGSTLHLPTRARDYPDGDHLALRFERFKAAV